MTIIRSPEVVGDRDPPPADLVEETAAAEALFPEARRRERRRRLMVIAASITILIGTGVALFLADGGTRPASHLATSPEGSQTPGSRPIAIGGPLQHPYGLAVGPNGDLYVVDVGRDQVLRRPSNGRFQVVAGNGKRGYSGDGGRAVDAELNLEPSSAIAIAKDGTLYIADSRNDRVRAVSPDGTIRTVAGDGRSGKNDGLILHTTPALDAAIGRPSGLAIGPNGDLYIAAGSIVRLTSKGALQWVAGIPGAFPCGSVFCNRAGEGDFVGADQLAFDGVGDLYVSGSSYGLLEISAKGRLEYLGQSRGNGAPEALAEAPDGSVVEAERDGLARLSADGKVPLPSQSSILAPGAGIRGDRNLDHALGRHKNFAGGYNIFIGGDGVAVGPKGTIYADTNTGNTFTVVSALVEVRPNGSVTALWRS